jgi:proteasome lid subunit RPN8/RPN11
MPEIRISRKIATQLLHHAQTFPGQEVCGLIGAKNGLPTNWYAIDNVAEQPHHRFLLEPSQQIAAMKKMREEGEQFFAIYHSHPAAPAVPSRVDIELNAYTDAYYMIISLNTKGVLEMRAFKMARQQAEEVPIVLYEQDPDHF